METNKKCKNNAMSSKHFNWAKYSLYKKKGFFSFFKEEAGLKKLFLKARN